MSFFKKNANFLKKESYFAKKEPIFNEKFEFLEKIEKIFKKLLTFSGQLCIIILE